MRFLKIWLLGMLVVPLTFTALFFGLLWPFMLGLPTIQAIWFVFVLATILSYAYYTDTRE